VREPPPQCRDEGGPRAHWRGLAAGWRHDIPASPSSDGKERCCPPADPTKGQELANLSGRSRAAVTHARLSSHGAKPLPHQCNGQHGLRWSTRLSQSCASGRVEACAGIRTRLAKSELALNTACGLAPVVTAQTGLTAAAFAGWFNQRDQHRRSMSTMTVNEPTVTPTKRESPPPTTALPGDARRGRRLPRRILSSCARKASYEAECIRRQTLLPTLCTNCTGSTRARPPSQRNAAC